VKCFGPHQSNARCTPKCLDKAKRLLQATPFAYLAEQLVLVPRNASSSHSHSHFFVSSGSNTSLPALTPTILSIYAQQLDARPPTQLIASLHTSSPPCPGCRSTVTLQFHLIAPVPSSSRSSSSWRKKVKRELMGWKKDWEEFVTGRTIALRLATEYSFLVALMPLIRSSLGSNTANV